MTGGGETIGASGKKSTIGGTFRGKMTKDSMLDDNELNDNNNDGVITDEDVFGEYLYSRCHNTNITLTNDEKYFCESMRTGTSTQHNDRAQDLTNHWITFDIVQFVGNNQPQDGDNCRIGSLHNCRGYYDAEGKFHKEQQGFSVPLATSPNPFYKYATINNSPDLFIPILQVIAINDHYNNTGSILQDLSGLSSSGNEVVFDVNNLNNSNDIALDYFEPEIKVQYGNVSYDNDKNPRWLKMKFNETTQQTGNFGQNVYEFFETDFRNEKLCTSYYLEKGATIYPAPSANVCLKQINNCNCIQSSNGLFQCGTDNQDNITVQKIKCFTRKNPSPYYFLIKPVSDSINTMTPYANAYFYNRKNSTNSTEPLKNNSNDILRFYNTLSLNESTMTEANAKITSGNYAYSQGYPIYLSKGECAIINYNCIDTKKQYQARQRQGESENTAEMMLLMKNLKLCEQYELNCLAASGGSTSVQKKNSDGTYSVIDIKDSGGYNLNGQQNNMCVTSGFEDYIPYVKAYKTYNSISVGKCILDEDSKKKSECRRQEYYTFCSQRSNTCKCLDGTNTCTCNGTNCIETHSCNCSGNNCTQLDSACYLPGYNSLGTLLKADGTVDRICKCELITSQDVNNSNVETGFEYRKATPATELN